jgi:hypothetical protein
MTECGCKIKEEIFNISGQTEIGTHIYIDESGCKYRNREKTNQAKEGAHPI